jgi:hypothetical protein
MALELKVSEPTLDVMIKKLKKKIMKILWKRNKNSMKLSSFFVW